MSTFIVVEKATRMPNSCWTGRGRYRKVAVVEVDGTVAVPRMISERARGVLRVVRVWDRVFRGSSDRCAAERARSEAEQLAGELNAGRS